MKTVLVNASKWEDYLLHRKEHIRGELGQGLYGVSPGVRAYLRGQEELLGELLSILRLMPTEAIEEVGMKPGGRGGSCLKCGKPATTLKTEGDVTFAVCAECAVSKPA